MAGYLWDQAKRNAFARLSLPQRAAIARAQAERTLARLKRKDAHSDWMDECVPKLMDYGKDQDVAVAACLNMWRENWEISHPGGEVDPGPERPEKVLQRARALLEKFDAEAAQTLARLKENCEIDPGKNSPSGLSIGSYDPSQPRDEQGRWTDTGAAGSGDSDQPVGSGQEDAPRDAGGIPQSFDRESVGDAERVRGAVGAWKPSAADAARWRDAGVTPISFTEYAGPQGAAHFHQAIVAAKAASKHGAAVTTYEPSAYAGMRLFTSVDGNTGFALKGDDIVSVFKHPQANVKKFATPALALAVQQGGRKLDAFDTVLPKIYSDNGFRVESRIGWDDSQKPDGWDYATFKEFNDGRPDVTFMVFDGVPKQYRPGDGKRYDSYDAAVAAQSAAVERESARLADDLPHFPPMPVPHEAIGEKTSDSFQTEISHAINSLPPKVIERLNKHGVTFKTGKMVTEICPDLKGVHPRGWGRGMTWDHAEGLFRRASKLVVTTEFKKRVGGEVVPTTRASGVLLHETGHAFDQALDYPSNSSAFRTAYDADKKMLKREDRDKLKYYLQSGEAGKTEAFAEIFAASVSGDKGSSWYDIRPYFRNTTAWVEDVIARGNYSV